MSDVPETLQGMSHTNPNTGHPFGKTQVYGRGKTVVADGGETDATEESETLKDVSHTSDDTPDGAQRTFDRGEDEQR